jgi:thioredoxin reductase
MEDVVICGGGIAGLSAATWIGRYRRRAVVIDAGGQRNLPATESHGYLGSDNIAPGELLDAARRDLARYDTVTLASGSAEAATREGDHFLVSGGGRRYRTQRLVIATGVEDEFPDIPGFHELYGKCVWHCSCCDGYEAGGHDVVAIGWGEHSAGYALDLLEWGARVTLVTNGNAFEADEPARAAIERHDIELVEDRVLELTRRGGTMTGARLASGRTIPATKAFFSIAHHPRTELARRLGCRIDDEGYVSVDDHGETSVAGVYAAGDVTPGEQLVQVAAAEGAIAGIACAMSLRGLSTSEQAPDPGPDPATETAKSV